MKSVLLKIFIFILIINPIEPCFAQDLLKTYEYMKLSEAEKKWGSRSFDTKRFKSGSVRLRAQMTHSLVKNKKYVGVSIKKVFSDLGPSTGYFFSESIPAYVIQSGGQRIRDVWQIIFLPEENSEKVKEVLIQKKCCYTDRV